MKKPLQVGDRVAAYTINGRKTGILQHIGEDGITQVKLDELHHGHTYAQGHLKSLRRLRKRERRRVWLMRNTVINNVAIRYEKPELFSDGWVEFVEARPGKGEP